MGFGVFGFGVGGLGFRREVRQLKWRFLCRPLYHYIAQFHPLFGSSTQFHASPVLPEGMEVDPDTGTIHGRPLSVCPETMYTITGSNEAGSASISLQVEVLEAPTAAGYRGFVIPLPPTVAESHNAGKFEATTRETVRVGYLRGEDIKIDAPRIRGTPPLIFSVQPPLPQGIFLNTDSGAIRGLVRSVPCFTPTLTHTLPPPIH